MQWFANNKSFGLRIAIALCHNSTYSTLAVTHHTHTHTLIQSATCCAQNEIETIKAEKPTKPFIIITICAVFALGTAICERHIWPDYDAKIIVIYGNARRRLSAQPHRISVFIRARLFVHHLDANADSQFLYTAHDGSVALLHRVMSKYFLMNQNCACRTLTNSASSTQLTIDRNKRIVDHVHVWLLSSADCVRLSFLLKRKSRKANVAIECRARRVMVNLEGKW